MKNSLKYYILLFCYATISMLACKHKLNQKTTTKQLCKMLEIALTDKDFERRAGFYQDNKSIGTFYVNLNVKTSYIITTKNRTFYVNYASEKLKRDNKIMAEFNTSNTNINEGLINLQYTPDTSIKIKGSFRFNINNNKSDLIDKTVATVDGQFK